MQSALNHLLEHGYAVIERGLDSIQLEALRSQLDEVVAAERAAPVVPADGPSAAVDSAIEAYLADSYPVRQDELARLMQRIRSTRAAELDTPWPFDMREVNKTFLHLPTLFADDRSQRIWNLLKNDTRASSQSWRQ